MKYLFSTLALAIAMQSANAQREYLVEVNPETGTVTHHTTLYDVNYIAAGSYSIDPDMGYFTFPGKDFSGKEKLYTVSLNAKQMLYNPPVTLNNFPMHYDVSNHTLYAVVGDLTGSNRVVSIAPHDGVQMMLGTTYQGASSLFNTTYDNVNRRMINITTYNNKSTIHYVKMMQPAGKYAAVDNGAGTVYGLSYDEHSGKLFALKSNSATDVSLIVFDDAGNYTVLYHFGNVAFNSCTINKTTRELVVIASTDNNINKSLTAFTFSLPDGSLKKTMALPELQSQADNLNSIAYDNVRNTYYMLHWDSDTSSTILNIPAQPTVQQATVAAYPNPFGKSFNITLNAATAGKATVKCYNITGILQFEETFDVNVGSNGISVKPPQSMTIGNYFIFFASPDGTVYWRMERSNY